MSNFPAGIIQQVDRDGHQANFSSIGPPEAAAKEPVPPPRRKTPWSFKSLFCGCFSPQIDGQHRGENGVDIQVANNHALLQEGGVSNISFHPSEEGYLLPEKCIPAKITLILDLDETLVHSSFKPVANADFVVPVEVDGTVHRVFVCKRPGVDEFMKRVGELFEVVVFTASLDKYANPVLDLLDRTNSVHYRLFREACVMNEGSLVKDLTRLGRDVKKCIIVDNSPMSYMLQPENAVPISSWFDDPSDDQLYTLLPWFVGIAQLEDVLPNLDDLRHQMNMDGGNYTGLYSPGANGAAHSAENEYAINEFIDHEGADPLLGHGQL